MRPGILLSAFVAIAFTAACGPSGRPSDDTGGPDAPSDTMATISGKVWAPKQAPGQVPPGEEIPIAGALVYITNQPVAPIPDHVYCEQCVPTPDGGVLTGPDGSFTLTVVPGNYTMIIQKGQYRIDQPIALSAGTQALPPAMTTLPS